MYSCELHWLSWKVKCVISPLNSYNSIVETPTVSVLLPSRPPRTGKEIEVFSEVVTCLLSCYRTELSDSSWNEWPALKTSLVKITDIILKCCYLRVLSLDHNFSDQCLSSLDKATYPPEVFLRGSSPCGTCPLERRMNSCPCVPLMKLV